MLRYDDEICITDKGRTRFRELKEIGYSKLPYWEQRDEFELLSLINRESITNLHHLFSPKAGSIGFKLERHPRLMKDYVRQLGRLEKQKCIKIIREKEGKPK